MCVHSTCLNSIAETGTLSRQLHFLKGSSITCGANLYKLLGMVRGTWWIVQGVAMASKFTHFIHWSICGMWRNTSDQCWLPLTSHLTGFKGSAHTLTGFKGSAPNLTGFKGSAPNFLLPATRGHLKRSCIVNALVYWTGGHNIVAHQCILRVSVCVFCPWQEEFEGVLWCREAVCSDTAQCSSWLRTSVRFGQLHLTHCRRTHLFAVCEGKLSLSTYTPIRCLWR